MEETRGNRGRQKKKEEGKERTLKWTKKKGQIERETKQANCVNTCARKMESENKELPARLTVYEPAYHDNFVVWSVTKVLHTERCIPDHTNRKLSPQRQMFLPIRNNN